LTVLTASANADPTNPFAIASVRCAADGDEATSPSGATTSGPLEERHFLPVARIEGDAQRGTFPSDPGWSANPYGYGAANLDGQGTWGTHPRAIDDIGTDAYYGASPTVFWEQLNTFEVGQSPRVSSDCGEGEHQWTTRAKFYKRPPTPVSFTGSRNHHQSHVGFTAPQAGHYIAEVTRVDLAGLRVARESYSTGEGRWIEDGEFRSGTFNQPGTLDLGTLSAGPHALTVQGVQDNLYETDPDRMWTVQVRYVPPSQPPPPSKPTDPPVVTRPPGTPPAPPATPSNPTPEPGDPLVFGPPTPPTPVVVTVVAPPMPSGSGVAGMVVSRPARDRTRPELQITVRREGRYRRIRVRCINERCSLRVTVRYGSRTRVFRRNLSRNSIASLKVRPNGSKMRITVDARDKAGNRTLVRRTHR
jgi:hypothetical protein